MKQTVDAIERLVISMRNLPEDERIHVFDIIANHVCKCLEIAESLNRQQAVISENLERLLHSSRCLARLEDDDHTDDFHITWALSAINNLRVI